MKNLYFIFSLLFFCSAKIQAQSWWDWSVPTGAVYSDDYDASPVSVTVDGQNNYLLLNSEEIIKYNRNGTLKWKKKTISDARGICTDANGNIYANAQFEPNGGKITKLDADSNIIWSVLKQKYNTYRNVVMCDIYVAPDGDVYASGYFNPYGGVANNDSLFWGNTALPLGPATYYDQYVIIAKISRQGVPQWIRMLHCAKNNSIQSRRSHFYSIAKDNSSNVYITGDLADGSLYLDHDTLSSIASGAYSGFVMQINDNNGTVNWAKSVPPVLSFISPNSWTLHEPCFAALHGNNGILIAGSNGYLSRPAGQYIWNSRGYIISYDSLGNQVWKKNLSNGILGFEKKAINIIHSIQTP